MARSKTQASLSWALALSSLKPFLNSLAWSSWIQGPSLLESVFLAPYRMYENGKMKNKNRVENLFFSSFCPLAGLVEDGGRDIFWKQEDSKVRIVGWRGTLVSEYPCGQCKHLY